MGTAPKDRVGRYTRADALRGQRYHRATPSGQALFKVRMLGLGVGAVDRKAIALPLVPGTRVTSFTRGPGASRFDVGGTHGFSAALTGTWQLVVEDRGVVWASGDEGQSYGLGHPIDLAREAAALVVGRALIRARAYELTGDLELELDGGVLLRIVGNSSGFEAWDLSAGDGSEWVAQGGGRVVRL